MKVLLIGSGGREHALAWKIQQSPRVQSVYLCNDINPATVLEEVKDQHIHLVVIGGEEPLAAGLSDYLIEHGIRVFGPSRAAAEIESSKAFAKNFMQRHAIPTARYAIFKNFNEAIKHIEQIDYEIVIKASGLAAGKGVYLPSSKEEAKQILEALMLKKTLGAAGDEILIEEFLVGQEVSILAFSDGKTIRIMLPARDYKRLKENDNGPNTGGMGAYAPVREITEAQIKEYCDTILQPTIDGLRKEDRPFVGVIYAGLMLTAEGPRVLEFNCRFGDPETQVLMPLLATDLIEIIEACIDGELERCRVNWHDMSAVSVVLASQNYPTGKSDPEIIQGLQNEKPNSSVFLAGTEEKEGEIFAVGGRILSVTGWGPDLVSARQRAYSRISTIYFKGMQYRTDIAQKIADDTDHYAAAGVSIDAGNHAVTLMTNAVKATYTPAVLAGIGAFGGMFDASLLQKMQAPVLVASTDGIGTKVDLAAQHQHITDLGTDIVNHCVNDILVQGARPLFFLDYVASSKLDPQQIATLVTSMANACRKVNCALLGGETAEMPGIYQPNRFDVAGTIVGVVEKTAVLPKQNLQEGDVLLGLASSGPHTNGYSLIRKIIENLTLETGMIETLLAPHRCYLSVLMPVLEQTNHPIKALVHITGGGFLENIPRVLPKHLSAKVNLHSWPVPTLFRFLQTQGNIPTQQMYRVLNMGIGMILIVSPQDKEQLKAQLNEDVWEIGQLIAGNKEVHLQ